MRNQLLIATLFVAILAGCTRFEEPTPTWNAETEETSETRSGEATTFEKMANPYKLSVMQAVYDMAKDTVTLKPTDLYVRFLPQDTIQMRAISDLELFDFPLDIKLEEGQEYVDPTIPEGEQGWLYTTVKPDYEFPEGLVYEIIEECYIPEEGESIETQPLTRSGEGETIDVERAAFEKMGYEPESAPATRANVKPRGTIRVWDDITDSTGMWRPVKGVKIRCHVIVKWSTTYTREDGTYTMESNFAIGPHYAIVYDNNKGFTIWGNWGFLAAANHNMGWHSQKGYSEDLDKGRTSRDWAIVNNAAWEYYRMCEETGITKPPINLKIWVSRDGKKSSAPMIRRFSIARILNKDNWAAYLGYLGFYIIAVPLDAIFKWAEPDLIIGTKSAKNYRRIYEIVNHELSHASHFNQVSNNYWSHYISHIITNLGYGSNGDGPEAGYCEVGEMWGYAMGHIQECEIYNHNRLDDVYFAYYSNDYDNFGRPEDWLHPDPLWALITRGVLTKRQIFDCLTTSVDSREKLLNALCARYPNNIHWIRIAFEFDDVIEPAITGIDNPTITNSASYSIPENIPGGVTFNGWTFTGYYTLKEEVDYRIDGSLTNTEIDITFLSDRQATLTANFTLPGNVAHRVEKIVKPVPTGIVILGDDRPIGMGEASATYSIDPNSLPEGVRFVGWDVIPGTNGEEWSAGDINASTLNVTFFEKITYSIAAKFRWPNGFVSREYKSVWPTPITAPTIYGFKAEGGRWIPVTSGGAMTLSGFVVGGGGTGGTIPGNMRPAPQPVDRIPDFGKPLEPWAKIQVSNATSNEVDYEWSINGAIQTGEDEWSWPYLEFIQKTFYDRAIRCRAVYHGATSDWSNVIILTSSTIIDGTLAAPVISADKTSAASGEMVTFTVADPKDFTNYEWEKNGVIVSGERGATVSLPAAKKSSGGSISTSPYIGGTMEVRCRQAGGVSEWSAPVTVSVSGLGNIVGNNPGGGSHTLIP